MLDHARINQITARNPFNLQQRTLLDFCYHRPGWKGKHIGGYSAPWIYGMPYIGDIVRLEKQSVWAQVGRAKQSHPIDRQTNNSYSSTCRIHNGGSDYNVGDHRSDSEPIVHYCSSLIGSFMLRCLCFKTRRERADAQYPKNPDRQSAC